MKPHLVLRLARSDAPPPRRAHWTEAIRDKSLTAPLSPAIDAALARHGLPVWTTAEYRPGAGGEWSADERAAGLDRIYRLVLERNGRIPPALIDDIRLLPEVEDLRVGQIGAERLAPRQSIAQSRRQRRPQAQIGLDLAHRMGRGEPTVTVAVLDTGVDIGHPEFEGRMRDGADFVNILSGAEEFIGDVIGADHDPADEVGHGTHVSGIIAARGLGMSSGVAPGCTVMPVRVLATMERDGEKLGAGLIENINTGVKYAIDHGAQIINMSLGVRHEGGGLPHQEVVDYARRKGVLIVAASGNDGTETLYYPGAFDSVMAVGASGEDGRVAGFSTFGPQVKLIAPGEEIVSAKPGGGYAAASGTSQAAPFVAGAAALLQSLAHRAGGRFSARDLTEILISTADRPGPRYRDRRAGFGRLNAADAMRLARARIN